MAGGTPAPLVLTVPETEKLNVPPESTEPAIVPDPVKAELV
jgi:hypothetical protein